MKLNYIKNFIQNSNAKSKVLNYTIIVRTHNKFFSAKSRFIFNNGLVKLPHFSKIEKGGEDALVANESIICVSDGVGGWAEEGVDPAKYSNELCENIKKSFIVFSQNNLYHQPKKIFIEAANKTLSKGSATCCLCILDLEKNYLHTLNLGDSGYLILRPSIKNDRPVNGRNEDNLKNDNQATGNKLEIIYKSEEQTHGFNFPFQVGTFGDDPSTAQTKIHEIRENDLIVLGTDGLWDNLFEKQIIQVIQTHLKNSPVIQDLSVVAKDLGQTAENLSHSQNYNSPFAVRSGGQFIGGKPDDITIIVSQIIKKL